MSAHDNILLHQALIAKARQLPVASTKRLLLISRSIQGILRARQPAYNPHHFVS